jgi:hypothetical protein
VQRRPPGPVELELDTGLGPQVDAVEQRVVVDAVAERVDEIGRLADALGGDVHVGLRQQHRTGGAVLHPIQ